MVLKDQELLKQGHIEESCSSDNQLGLAEMVLFGLLPPSEALSSLNFHGPAAALPNSAPTSQDRPSLSIS